MKILILDDDELSVEMMETLLELNGSEVHTFTNPAAAIDSIKATEYDLILTDFMMPGMNGTAFIDTIKDYISKSRVAFTTAYMKDLFGGNTESGRKIDRIFVKPINVDELIEYVNSIK